MELTITQEQLEKLVKLVYFEAYLSGLKAKGPDQMPQDYHRSLAKKYLEKMPYAPSKESGKSNVSRSTVRKDT